MSVELEFDPRAWKEWGKLGNRSKRNGRRVMLLEAPRDAGKSLTGNLPTYWRYRVNDEGARSVKI
jgi:mRNA-degrading endonuclease RelE of RelBE toxin-antitoxin system